MSMVLCRGCSKEIHQTALACPSCGAPQGETKNKEKNVSYSSYDQVPWFRKSWFIVVGFIIFAPATLYSLFSGDIYYLKNGNLLTYSKVNKIASIVLCSMMSLFLVGQILGSNSDLDEIHALACKEKTTQLTSTEASKLGLLIIGYMQKHPSELGVVHPELAKASDTSTCK